MKCLEFGEIFVRTNSTENNIGMPNSFPHYFLKIIYSRSTQQRSIHAQVYSLWRRKGISYFDAELLLLPLLIGNFEVHYTFFYLNIQVVFCHL